MFVIVHNNSVIWGPKNWNKRGFEEVILEDCEIHCTLPTRNNEANPIRINDEIVILRVVPLDTPWLNQKTHRLEGPFWNFYEDRAEMYYTVVDLPVYFVKDKLHEQIAINRNKVENSSTKIMIGNTLYTIRTDKDSRHLYTTTSMTMEPNDKVEWKFPEGWTELKKPDIMKIIAAINKHIGDSFVWERKKSDEINAANTLEELDAIDLEYRVENA